MCAGRCAPRTPAAVSEDSPMRRDASPRAETPSLKRRKSGTGSAKADQVALPMPTPMPVPPRTPKEPPPGAPVISLQFQGKWHPVALNSSISSSGSSSNQGSRAASAAPQTPVARSQSGSAKATAPLSARRSSAASQPVQVPRYAGLADA